MRSYNENHNEISNKEKDMTKKSKKLKKKVKTIYGCKCGEIKTTSPEEFKNIKGKRCFVCGTKVKERVASTMQPANKEIKKRPIVPGDQIIEESIKILIPTYSPKTTYRDIDTNSFFVYNGDVFFKVYTGGNTSTAINILTGERFRERLKRTHENLDNNKTITKEVIENTHVISVFISNPGLSFENLYDLYKTVQEDRKKYEKGEL